MITPCPIAGVRLDALRDGELEPAASAALVEHVNACAACQARLADAEATASLLGEQLRAERAQAAAALPAEFSRLVMAALPAESAPGGLWSGLRAHASRLRALALAHREALGLGLIGAAIVASLAVVFAPGLRTNGSSEEAAENEAHIHRLEVSGPDQNAMVLQSSEGNTVIWMVSQGDEDGGEKAPAP